jgi:hypothetical protein
MYKALLYLFNIIHILIVLFVVLIPFVGSNWFLMMHAIIVPFIMLHWITNNNTCALTIFEYYLREVITGKPVDRSQCFAARLIDPVYDFHKDSKDISPTVLYTSVSFFLSVSIGRLIYKKYTGEISSWQDLFKI